MSRPPITSFIALPFLLATAAVAAESPADASLADYFRAETKKLADACLSDVKTPADWAARRQTLRKQLAEMLGLDPWPGKTDLKATVTGRVDHPSFKVENLHFQSRPGLYVTGNLYLPKDAGKPVPAVLYVCGHAVVKKGDVSYGNKTAYQHHAAWFASHGYACLVIDTLQLGEIEGIHHGTYREKMWWWNSRGYTPAGVEAWNCVRALDYLQTRKEVDGEKLGVTGRSGGGAYSWWLAALDDRVKAAVPVAGITDLHNHVVDGAVEGHCDCMYFVNTYRWDYPAVAALVAPRPLLIANTDKDGIFPLDGVERLHWKVRKVYMLGNEDTPYKPAKNDLGLQVSEGGHVDSPELQVAAFRWFNRFLKGDDAKIEKAAEKVFEPEQLRVFRDGLPPDAMNGKIQETFVPPAPRPEVPASKEAWAKQRDGWVAALKDRVFRGWPADGGGPLDVTESSGAYEFSSQPHVRLRLERAESRGNSRPRGVVLRIGEGPASPHPASPHPASPDPASQVVIRLAPRGTGPSAWTGDEKKQTQIRRRFMMVGQTLEGMQAWDVRRAVQAIGAIPQLKGLPLTLEARGEMAGVALYASLLEPGVTRLNLHGLPRSHAPQGPHFLNVLRFLDVPQAVALAAEGRDVHLYQDDPGGWEFPAGVAKRLGWPQGRLTVHKTGPDEPAGSK